MSSEPVDHRRLGRDLELFWSAPMIGAGLPVWLPDGAAARHAVEEHLREEERRAGYQHVWSPPMAKRELYERSGHLDHFAADMFPPMALSADDEFVLRPSLCPQHALIFAARGRSYRELPLRVAELGGMYRAERSGVLGGLNRVRAISLNDAHVFCAPEQVAAELRDVLAMIRRVHAALGVRPSGYRLSLRGEGGGYVADPAMWERAEALLRTALRDCGIGYAEAPGEAAFYGPKIDVQVRDGAGRESTLSTVQVDFHQPERFDLRYVDRGGRRRRPVMVHRSLAGSMERLFAYLIEEHRGAFPLWFAPVQVAVLPVSPDQDAAARQVVAVALAAGLRAGLRVEGSLGARVREAVRRGVPYVAIVGAREESAGEVALRRRDGAELPPRPVAGVIAMIRAEVDASRAVS